MIDARTVEERLDALAEYIDKLRPLADLSPDELADADGYVEYWAVQRGLEMAVQCVLDVSSHLAAGLRLARPKEYRESILALGDAGILPSDFANRLSQIAGLRNIMVHEYLEIDPFQIHQAITVGLADLETYASYVVAYLSREGYLED